MVRMDGEKLTSLYVNILPNAQNLSQSIMLDVFLPSRKLLPSSGHRPSPLPLGNLVQKRECEVEEEEWEGLEATSVWLVRKGTSRTELLQVESLVTLAQGPAQAMASAYTTSGQEHGKFFSEAPRL